MGPGHDAGPWARQEPLDLKRLAARSPTYTATEPAGQAALATLRRLA